MPKKNFADLFLFTEPETPLAPFAIPSQRSKLFNSCSDSGRENKKTRFGWRVRRGCFSAPEENSRRRMRVPAALPKRGMEGDRGERKSLERESIGACKSTTSQKKKKE
ncbi:hypothetical protein GmHk_20G058571 [Glycine max]|nr:hypothetical protein GmHk_20G058571 [Glycine max]